MGMSCLFGDFLWEFSHEYLTKMIGQPRKISNDDANLLGIPKMEGNDLRVKVRVFLINALEILECWKPARWCPIAKLA